ncbi:unnamed protein product [Somion occarium]|uniref:Uncharacterized protein n=1 Tax=Somion occarium TaxID=3059160 RepID=A0ABP1DNU5_9APHY
MRLLTLHASALNDAEYDLYTTSLRDLVDSEDDPNDNVTFDDAHYERFKITVREARAWLRGRYNDMPVHEIDSILKTIAPSHEGLTGGQFFAVMRLVMHARNGKEVDGSLVFEQAHPPTSPTTNNRNLPPSLQQDETPRRVDVPLSGPSHSVPAKRASQPPPTRPTTGPNATISPPSIPPKPTNPFINRSRSQDPPPVPLQNALTTPRMRTSTTQPPLPPRKPSMGQAPPPPPPRHAALHQSSTIPISNVLIQQSLQATRIAQSLKKAEEKLQKERVLEVLKTSSNTKRTRSISPTKDPANIVDSSSSASGSSSRHSDRPALPPRRKPSPPLSTNSMEQVATAKLYLPRHKPVSPFFNTGRGPVSQSPFHSPARSPPKVPVELETESSAAAGSIPNQPPPMHPDRKLAVSLDSQEQPSLPPSPSSTNSTRLFRSKSMHQPTPPPVPPPIRSKKRPESIQFTGAGAGADGAGQPSTSGGFPIPPQSPARPAAMTNHNLSRHLSLSSPAKSRERPPPRDPTSMSDSPLASLSSIQRTLNQLQQKAQPKLDAARYKAEAGLSKRGFVNHSQQRWLRRDGEEPLMDEPEPAPANGWADRRVFDDDGDEDFEEFERVEREDRDGHGRREESGTSADEEKEGRSTGKSRRNGTQKDLGGKRVREGSPRGREWLYERDDLKWPAGEGWKPL